MGRFARFGILGVLSLAFISSGYASVVPREERELIAIVNLSRLAKIKLNYQYEEGRAVMKIKRDLGQSYRKIHILKGKQAGHTQFLKTLTAVANDPVVKAIDVIIYLHGHPGEIGFVDTGFYPTDRLRDEILSLPYVDSSGPRKFRALYSDACYGESHIADWLKAGFRVASGAVGVDGNWSLDLKKFMAEWRKGGTFGRSIEKANSVRATKLMDWIAKGNSLKKTEGAVGFNIEMPADAEPLTENPHP